MTNIFHPAPERGHVDFGWLDSHHSFSFGNWYNGEKVHFGALRVLNDDVVKGGNGFDSHPHENMEIISIPLKGALAHKDSTGIEGILGTGDVQIMSAGSGIRHSEYNASPNGPEGRSPKARHKEGQATGAYSVHIRSLDKYDPVNFLQIWIFPKHLNIKPRHDQKSFDAAGRIGRWQFVVSPRSEDGGLYINQDARLALTRLEAGTTLRYDNAFAGNGVYVFVLAGNIMVGDADLSSRDGLGVSGTDSFMVRALADSELLAIEVPMFA
jgi:redox-sensitive bicupin YhaK (pirin superfamily)